ncbi:hypothetical protein ACE4RU_10705 [Actinobacillus seminis]
MKEITDKEKLDFLQNKRVEIVQEREEELQLCIFMIMGARNEFC